ncbi:hypothetical protein FVR03_16750 [Pontibacter qinzhouensis]|uniref:Uncharacterized protein n=1 Tax=Pontibacter qinzhouensis TaxID=2603253 RepID=A0A5C8JHE2_9BACT|nr:hypothetical protein [Pontibacter qinzhouensis]TXK36791.1 hypothetical protein FVR03_16750 [Pontibacter qinzhouensis]
MLTLTKEPNFIDAAYNKIEFSFNKSDYQVGDRAFCEIYRVNSTNISTILEAEGGQLITTLTANGRGDGNYTFDVSSVMQYAFAEFYRPDSRQFQRDTTSYVGYYIKAGRQTFNGTLQQKTYDYTSSVKFAMRAALDRTEAVEFNSYVTNYQTPVKFLSSSPNIMEVRTRQNSYLSFLLVDNTGFQDREVQLIADKYYKDGTSELHKIVFSNSISEGGVYIYNISPDYLEPDISKRIKLSSYEVYVDFKYNGSVDYYAQGYEQGRLDAVTFPNYRTPSCEINSEFLPEVDCSLLRNGYSRGYNEIATIFNAGSVKGYNDSRDGISFVDGCNGYSGLECEAYANGYERGYQNNQNDREYSWTGFDVGIAYAGLGNQYPNNTCPVGVTSYRCDYYKAGYKEGFDIGKAKYQEGFAAGQAAYNTGVTTEPICPVGSSYDECVAWENGYKQGYLVAQNLAIKLVATSMPTADSTYYLDDVIPLRWTETDTIHKVVVRFYYKDYSPDFEFYAQEQNNNGGYDFNYRALTSQNAQYPGMAYGETANAKFRVESKNNPAIFIETPVFKIVNATSDYINEYQQVAFDKGWADSYENKQSGCYLNNYDGTPPADLAAEYHQEWKRQYEDGWYNVDQFCAIPADAPGRLQ